MQKQGNLAMANNNQKENRGFSGLVGHENEFDLWKEIG